MRSTRRGRLLLPIVAVALGALAASAWRASRPPPPPPSAADAPAPPPSSPPPPAAPDDDARLVGDVLGLFAETHPWIDGRDGAPRLLVYFQSGAEGGVRVYDGHEPAARAENPWFDAAHRGDAVEGDVSIRFEMPPLGADSPVRDAHNASSRLLWRTFGPDDGAPYDVSRFRHVSVWIKPLDGFEGHVGLTLGSWDPAAGGANGDAGPSASRLFPQPLSGARWHALTMPLDAFDGVDLRRFAKYALDLPDGADGHTFLIDQLVFTVERPPGAPAGQADPYALADSGEDPTHADDTLRLALDRDTRHQTMRGFGFFGDGDAAVRLVREAGASLVRLEIPSRDPPPGEPASRERTEGWEPVDDGGGDLSFLERLDGFGRASLEPALATLRALREVDPSIAFFACPWSAPGWMKRSGRVTGGSAAGPDGNRLRAGLVPEYAEFLASFALHLHREGLPLLALSVGNEVHFDHEFQSMRLEGDDLLETVRETDRRLGMAAAAEPGFAPPLLTADDHVLDDGFFERDFVPMLDALGRDPASRRAVRVVSYHAYGVDAQTPERVPQTALARLRAKARETLGPDVELWMTETSGFASALLDDGDRRGALSMAEGVMTSLLYADAAAWVYFGTDGLVRHGRLGWPGVVLAHFARHVRPGAVRVEARLDALPDRVLVAVFEHAAEDGGPPRPTAVIVNIDDRPHGLDLTALFDAYGPAPFDELRSSRHHALDPMGEVGAEAAAAWVLPPHAVVTLHRRSPDRP